MKAARIPHGRGPFYLLGRSLKARLHRRFLSQQLNAVFVAPKFQRQNRTCKPLCDFVAILATYRRGMLLGVTQDNRLKFDAHIANICRKVGRQVNALNTLKNILPYKTKETLYRAFILTNFFYCSQVWHHCGARNTTKLEKVNERALRFIYKDNSTSYQTLLK